MRIRLPDGATEHLSEEQAKHLCEALWALSDVKGSIALLGKLSHQSKWPSTLAPVDLDEGEAIAFRRAFRDISASTDADASAPLTRDPAPD